MARTTYNVDAYEKHQKETVKESRWLTKPESQKILLKISELKDMLDNKEIGIQSKESIVLNKLNDIGAIIVNK